MLEPAEVANRALEIIRHLSEQIGPRPSGSPAEGQAHRYLQEILTASGYRCQMEDFTFPQFPNYYPYLAIPGLAFMLAAVIPPQWRIILIGMPFLVAGLPEIYEMLAKRLPRTIHSRNLLALPADTEFSGLDLLICAHVDSARVLPTPPAALEGITHNLMSILESLAWFSAVVGLIHLTLPKIGSALVPLSGFFLLVIGLLLVLADLWQQSSVVITSGANDNASGAALCTALGEYYSQNVPENLKIGLLISGAEEAGLYGARAFVQVHPPVERRPVVINLDMVGLGQRVGLVERAGRLKPRATDADLNLVVQSLEEDAVMVDYKFRSGDFVPFLQAGYRAISLEATDHGGVPPTYHQASDTAEYLNPQIIERIAAVVIELGYKSILR
jgi:hypothetical protein